MDTMPKYPTSQENGNFGGYEDPDLGNEFENPNGFLLRVHKVHAQMVFTKAAESGLPVRTPHSFVLIDFMSAVRGLGLYCGDLTDYIHIGDEVMTNKIETVGDLYYAKAVFFRETEEHARQADVYVTGTGIVDHVGDMFAGIRADDQSRGPEGNEFLMPITALTRNSIPPGRQLGDIDLRLKDLISPGDKVNYKVPRIIPVDENHRGQRQVVSVRVSARKRHEDEMAAGASSSSSSTLS